jgi:hypothetical protein
LTKTDDTLFELKKAFIAFLNSCFPFEYKNKIYRLVDNYVATPWIRCDICRSYPIQDVSVIRSNDGQELRVGNKCIDQITNRKISEWFSEFRTKRENITRNRRYIDYLTSILITYKRSMFPNQISENDIERLQKALERMCNGVDPTRDQEQLAEFYCLKARS